MYRRCSRVLIAAEERVDLDPEHDGELAGGGRLARLPRRGDDAIPALAGAAVLRVDERLQVVGGLQLAVDGRHVGAPVRGMWLPALQSTSLLTASITIKRNPPL